MAPFNAHILRELAVFGRAEPCSAFSTPQDPLPIAYARMHLNRLKPEFRRPLRERGLGDERYLVSVQRIVQNRAEECSCV